MQKQPPEVFCKRGVFRNFRKFTGKQLCQSFFFNKVAGLSPAILLNKRLWHRYFPVNFAKFLRTHFSKTPPVAASVNGNLWIFSFVKWHPYKEKSKENACKSYQIPVWKLSHLPIRNLISTCNCRVKSVSAGWVEISSPP